MYSIYWNVSNVSGVALLVTVTIYIEPGEADKVPALYSQVLFMLNTNSYMYLSSELRTIVLSTRTITFLIELEFNGIAGFSTAPGN